MKSTWVKRAVDEAQVKDLSQELRVSPLLATLLFNRKVRCQEQAELFLRPSLKHLREPYLFADMEKAVHRLGRALSSKEIIGVFGDYDVDGVCSAALLEEFLRDLGAQVVSTLPNRMTEGYGLSQASVDRLRDAGARLLITADCGILSHHQIDYANSLGMEVIVIDHHTVGESLPRALCIINPKRHDCSSEASHLCAAGVSFYFCIAARRYLREQGYFQNMPEPDLKKILDLVALATVCDVVPLIADNRAMVKAGLAIIKKGERVGLKALMDTCGVDRAKISSTNLGFHLGPRINAAGRLDDASSALTLLSSIDEQEALTLAQELNLINEERRALEQEMVDEVCAIVDGSEGLLPRAPAIVIHHEGFHPGVVGIVANRIAERYHRPSIIIGQKGKGSGRSIKGIDLHAMVLKAAGTLQGFGGHAHAIGLTLGTRGVEPFREELLAVMAKEVATEVFQKEIIYDAEVSVAELDLSLAQELSSLEPFGASNPYPMLRIDGCFLRNLKRLKGGHIRGEIEGKDAAVPFVGFRMDIDDDLKNSPIDILGILEKNTWHHRTTAQLRLVDYKKSP